MISRDNVQAIYPLLKKQRALAFYSLQSQQEDPGFIQLRFVIKGPLHQEALTRAWQALITRHESMRVSLQSPKDKPSLLVVLKSCDLPVEWVDKRADSRDAQQQYINRRLSEFRDNGLELSKPPVHRLLGVQTKDDCIEFLWACHHLFLDGWSAVVLLNDLAQLYASERAGTEVSPPAQSSQADYLKWLSDQSDSDSEKFWSEKFDGFTKPALIAEQFGVPQQQTLSGSSEHLTHIVYSDDKLNKQIERIATELKVTSASVVFVAWAMYLSTITDQNDITFGTTSAGRSFDLTDSQIMTGYFANVIARRFLLNRSCGLSDYIVQSHHDGFASLQFEHVPVDDVQSYAGLSGREVLFDHLVLFENLPQTDISLKEPDGAVSIGTFSGDLTSMYPLTLTILPGEKWRFKYLYADYLKDKELHRVLDGFPVFLTEVCSRTMHSVGQLLDWAKDTQIATLVQKSPVTQLHTVPTPLQQLARNKTELAIAAIWQDMLGVEEIDIHTEFIALGGRSIVAVKMIAQIEEKLGARLSMLDLVTHPTIAGLASRIDKTAAQSNWRSLIPLKPGGSKPPVIFIHAVGSHALFMRSVTGYFDEDQPVIGLQLVGLDGECKPMNSVEQIARHYLQEIQSYQPDGPYYFVAHCLGGIVAHEMIRMLHELNKEVALFVVLDAHAPFTEHAETINKKMRTLIHSNSGASRLFHYWEVTKRVAKSARYRLGVRATKVLQQYQVSFGSTMARKNVHLLRAHEASHAGANAYMGAPIDQKVVLIRSARIFEPYHMNWQDLSTDMDIIPLPVGHDTMFTEPEVGVLGRKLNELVRQASEARQTNRIEPAPESLNLLSAKSGSHHQR